MYFGDGAVNDLDDWSNFLEVPDFMASFNCSQVRKHILSSVCSLHADIIGGGTLWQDRSCVSCCWLSHTNLGLGN